MELSHRMQPDDPCPLVTPIATRLRSLLPADLYIAAWMDLSSEVAMQVFEHLRSLHWILHDYVPRQVAQSPPNRGNYTGIGRKGRCCLQIWPGLHP